MSTVLTVRRDGARTWVEPPEPSAVSWVPQQWVERVLSRYEREDHDVVDRFVSEHPELLGLLAEAPERIDEIFGPGTPVTLRISHDDEPGATDERQLHLLIHTNASVDEALALMNQLDDTWWLRHAPRVHGSLVIDVFFV